MALESVDPGRVALLLLEEESQAVAFDPVPQIVAVDYESEAAAPLSSCRRHLRVGSDVLSLARPGALVPPPFPTKDSTEDSTFAPRIAIPPSSD